MSTEPEKKPGKFQVVPPAQKPPVDPDALEQFAAGANATSAAIKHGASASSAVIATTEAATPAGQATAKPAASTSRAERNKAYLLHLTTEQFERMDQVFRASTFKSKQKMGEDLLMDAIENLGKQLGV